MNKKTYLIIAGILVVLVVAYFLATRKKKSESNFSRGKKTIPGTKIKYDYTLPGNAPLTPTQRKFCVDKWGFHWCLQIGGAGVSCKGGTSCCEYADGSDPLTASGACIRCCPNYY